MTEQEFVAGYCERSGITEAEARAYASPMRCACGERNCGGWAMVPNDTRSRETHRLLYAPKEDRT